MLIEFRVENHRSIRDEQVLSMEAAVDKGEKEDLRPRTVKGYKKKLLPVACIYGANASGKSNVLSALAWMRDAVRASSARWNPSGSIPRNQFAWGEKREQPSLFETTIVHNGVRYEYGFVATDDAFTEEWLYAWPRDKKQVWFERDRQKVLFGTELKSRLKSVAQAMRENSLFLSTAIQFNYAIFDPIYDWFNQLESTPAIGITPSDSGIRFGGDLWRFIQSVKPGSQLPDTTFLGTAADSFVKFLRQADIGILDVKVEEGEPVKPSRMKPARFLLRHDNSYDCEAWLDLDQESKGSQALFHAALPIMNTLENGKVLLIDELESSLHPALARYIVDLFNNPKTNPKNAQLIFTTHDTNLLGNTLGEPELRRDEVWLTEKDKDGATVLYPLTDYKPRAEENLERGYLQGRYGAIPFLGNFSLDGK